MSKVKDLTGKLFGKLTVIKQAPKPEGEKRSGAWWLCECECGNTIEVRGATLTVGDRTSCGCFQNPNHVGKKFGWLEVLEKVPSRMENGRNRSYWKCLCDCGNVCEVAGNSLVTGDTRSCGCMKSPNLVGQTFGRLKALERIEPSDPRNQTPHVKYRCICECGNETIADGHDLRYEKKRSCGCFMLESHITHGMSNTRTYECWQGMKTRCNNENGHAYDRYGGRGIAYDERWESFENFLEDMGEAPEGLTLERKDNSRGYSKDNCKWATYQEQNENKRNNNWITYKGETKTITEWSRITGICHATIGERLKRGWSVEEALTQPLRRNQWG